MRQSGITNVAPWSAAPTVGPAGDTYFNTTNKMLYVSDGTAWNPVAANPGSGSLIGIIAYGASMAAPAAGAKLPLDTVVGGNASWLANSRVVIPTGVGAAGLYLIQCQVQNISPTVIAVGFEIRNASGTPMTPQPLRMGGMANPGNPVNNVNGSWIRQCAENDSFAVWNYQNPITSGSAQVMQFSMVKIADSLATT
jgi:hypothetical protein